MDIVNSLNILDNIELINEKYIGHINNNEEINKKTCEYLNKINIFLKDNKLKTCEIFINEILSEFKKEPFELIIFITIKLYCNLRLHNYASITSDLNKIGNFENKNYKFETYPTKYSNKKGSMIPFILKLINCYYPYALNLYFTAFDRLYLLILNYEKIYKLCIQKIEECEEKKDEILDTYKLEFINKKKIFFHHIVITCYILCDLLLKRSYIQEAIDLLQNKILLYNPEHVNTISLIGKFNLMIGSFENAEKYFNLVKNIYNKKNEQILIHNKNYFNHIKMNDTIFNLFIEKYDLALNDILSIYTSDNYQNDKVISDYSIYINNLAIAYFYNAKVSKSIDILQESLNTNNNIFFQTSIKNINYFYELSKTKPEIVNKTNQIIKLNMSEDPEILSLIPNIE